MIPAAVADDETGQQRTPVPDGPAPAPVDRADGDAPVGGEISCRALANMALYCDAVHGREVTDRALARVGGSLTRDFILDTRNWVPFEFLARFADALVELSGDRDFMRKSGARVATPEALGFGYYFLRAIGSPGMVYRQVVKLGSTFNRVGTFTIEEIDDTRRFLRLRYTSTRDEPNAHLSEGRMGQFAAMPTIWGMPPAEITEVASPATGAPSWIYELRWPPTKRRPFAALTGLAGGAVLGEIALSSSFGFGVGSLAGGVAGALAGLAWSYRDESRIKGELLSTQQTGLEQSMRDLQSRYDEIQKLNATLEQRVEDRTAELAKTSARLKEALDKQLELDQLKTSFFQNVSHELRTPLTLILAPLETLLEDGSLPPDASTHLDVVRRSALKLLSLINSLLDLSRLDVGKMRLSLEDTDPTLMLKSIVESAQGLARQRGISLRYDGPERLAAVPLDVEKFDKAVLNLLSNALKFTGGDPAKTAEVVVSTRIEDGRLRVTVRDTGIGIAAAEQARVFQRFHQVDGSDQRRYGGTGIGLALVKELVEFHCGEVTLESTVGVGSAFTIDIPATREAYPADRLDRRSKREEVLVDRRSANEQAKLAELVANPSELTLADLASGEKAPDELTQGEAARVTERPLLLVADDNRDMLSYLAGILSREYDVITAVDGAEAFDKAVARRPSLIVSDVMMPVKNGHALVRELKALPSTRSIPVILLTAKAEAHQRVAGLEGGADDYLTKPFNFLELRARIRGLLKARAMERALAEKNEYLAKVNFDLVLAKKEVFLQTIEALAFSLEAKDPYTHGHSRRVAILSEGIGRDMSLGELELERVRISAVLHDIGKLGIPEQILRKEGRLTPEEQLVIRKHPEIGYRILESVKELADVNRCILLHHEQFDGTGYPQAKRGPEIPLESRIIAVADTYDAMTSDRPYRRSLGHANAIAEIRRVSGRQLDPEVVREFLKRYEGAPPVFPAFPSVFSRPN